MLKPDYAPLLRKMGLQFQNSAWIEQALSHRSVGKDNNERLEFLGDSILNFAMANLLYTRFPDATEGELSRLRAHLVREESLADIALEHQLSDYLRMGAGELRSGGFRRHSILADTIEAIIAAVYFDTGLTAALDFVERLYEKRLNAPDLRQSIKDPKTALQELLQAQKKSLPVYHLLKTEGDDHEQVFFVECEVSAFAFKTQGQGVSRRKAEQQAAAEMLARITTPTKKS